MGLIDYVTAQSLDADYAEVAERAAGRGEPAKSRSGLAALVMLALFGLLVTTAAVQTARNATATQSGHEELVTQIKARSAKVEAQRARANALRQEIDRLQSSYLQATAEGRALSSRLSKLGILTGAAPVTGPGVRVVVDDAPDAASAKQRVLDSDLQKLVNALWSAGAEAISVNGQRLTNLSAIRHAGGAITVNFRSVSRPYVVLAIGNPNQLPARFVETRHGSAWLDYQAAYGLQFEMTPEESLKLPAAPPLVLHHASSPATRP
jgi:uncharacterized protein YlxW (UPF0749 family)